VKNDKTTTPKRSITIKILPIILSNVKYHFLCFLMFDGTILSPTCLITISYSLLSILVNKNQDKLLKIIKFLFFYFPQTIIVIQLVKKSAIRRFYSSLITKIFPFFKAAI
ncbi:MAG: hypothetical protein ACOX5L_09580, partial [Bacteroidales bacterium]